MDLVIRNASIIDGSGAPATSGDIGIKDGRISALGVVGESGAEEIDAGGAVAAPGFIDVHTHYDAQAFWDPLLTPSIFHGVTSVIAGNCGFTLAPLSGKSEDSDYLLRMLSRVEGMPLTTLRKAVRPTWTGFGEYLDTLDGTLALNTAFMVGHSALRRTVMGERAVGQQATDDEIEQMKRLLAQSLSEGGVGYSTTVSATHSDYEGNPVPSRWASRDELLALASVLREFPGTWLEMVNGKMIFEDEDYALLTDMSLAAQRPLNWNLISVYSDQKQITESQLAAGDHAKSRGAKVYGLVPSVSPKIILNFMSGFVIDVIPNWSDILVLPQEPKIKALADPKVRQRLIEGAEKMEAPFLKRMFADWNKVTIEAVGLEKNQHWTGKLLGELARAKDKSPLDALFDLAVEENLRLSFSPPPGGEDDESWNLRAKTWRDDRAIIGASDAGAHLDMINTFAFSTQLLGAGVREKKLIPLEEAVHRITALPAERFGFKDRGRLAPGMAADITIFNPNTISCGSVEMRNDLPGDETRLTADAIGVPHVIVNGIVVVRDGAATGKVGGKVLRSGQDTSTVSIDAAA